MIPEEMKENMMTVHPCAKVNLGLNIVSRRPDGYHDLQSVFYPIPLHDTLTLRATDGAPGTCELHLSGIHIEGSADDNLVVRAYRLLSADHALPHVQIELDKTIPSQAGLGGGSSDAAFTLSALNDMFTLGLDATALRDYAVRLGADCPFFISSVPAYATGIGDVLSPLSTEIPLSGMTLVLVKPPLAVSTREAYSHITPKIPKLNCAEVVGHDVHTWRGRLTNDFEDSVFPVFPQIAAIKTRLYDLGALFALMSGSGSSVFGIFAEEPVLQEQLFEECMVYKMKM